MSELVKHSDAELVDAVRAGSHDAYKELVTRYQGHVYGLAYSIVGHWADAQDIAQETFIRAYMNLDQLREPAKFAAWLRRVAFSVAMAWIKAFRPKLFEQLDGRVDLEHLEIPDFQPGPAETAEKRELADAVLRAVAALPPKYRVPLTMFHLDGLSYQKVADFLDIPLGTAKSLIHRAQEKLKVSLAATIAQEASAMVQDVFNEHKLPGGFAARVLENIPPLSFEEGDCTFAGAVLAAMRFLKEDVSYPYVMGVSGGAFRLFFHREWCPSAGDLQIVGDEIVVKTLGLLGYKYEDIWRKDGPGEEERLRRIIVESIDKGFPVLACGIVGPPELGLVTGYEDGGKVLLGRSYFQDDHGSYYRKADWFGSPSFWKMTVLKEKVTAPSKREILKESLEWAVKIAHTPEISSREGAGYACGLAAYDAWAAALEVDADFPAEDVEALTGKCLTNANVLYCGIKDARKSAARFLTDMADACPACKADLLAAAKAYEAEVTILDPLCGVEVAYSWQPVEKRLAMADPKARRKFAEALRAARKKEVEAVKHLESILQTMNA